MSERDVTMLLDRMAARTPVMDVSVPDVVEVGRGRVRRRRVQGAGMTVGGLALAGAVWLGAGLGGGVLGTQQISPAGVTWEVDEPTTVTILDGVTRGGDVAPVAVTKSPQGSTATFTVDGREETVQGRAMDGGADVFVGERATVVVWAVPDDAAVDVQPWPAPDSYQSGLAQSHEDLGYLITDVGGYAPEGLVFHSGDAVWNAAGEMADTADLTDGRTEVTAFALPGMGLAGYLQEDQLTFVEPSSLHVSGATEPWWRGGDAYTEYLVRLPDEATYARVAWSAPSGEAVPGGRVPAVRVGDAAFAAFSFTEEEVPVAGDPTLVYEWSTDGHTWHTQDQDASPASEDGPSVAGPGEHVRLLDELYEVDVDQHGWPQLLADNGSTFLTVTDELGPSAGGMVHMNDRFWPWSPEARIHFYVGWQPPVGSEVVVQGEGEWLEPQDVVTISGPEGVVTLVSVPAGVARDSGGLGLRTDAGVRPASVS